MCRSTEPSRGIKMQHPPHVRTTVTLSPYFMGFLKLSHTDQQLELERFAWDRAVHGQFLHQGLRTVYWYLYDNNECLCPQERDTVLETRMLYTKAILEQDLITRWLPARRIPLCGSDTDVAQYFNTLAVSNAALDHAFYKWLATTASRTALMTYLGYETRCAELDYTIMDATTHKWLGEASKPSNATYDVCRRCLGFGGGTVILPHASHSGTSDLVRAHSPDERPWFVDIASNILRMTVTRPGFGRAACGHYMMTEALASAHCEMVLNGARRVGIVVEPPRVNGTARRDDKRYIDETGLPFSTQRGVEPEAAQQFLIGAHWAIEGALERCSRLMHHLVCNESVEMGVQGQYDDGVQGENDVRAQHM